MNSWGVAKRAATVAHIMRITKTEDKNHRVNRMMLPEAIKMIPM